jgi:pimeloyl-ACP methyl ester carboxylesterase
VLVHGACHTGRCWDPVVSELHHPAVAVDLPGRVPAADRRPFSIGDYATAVVDAVRASPFERVVLVGHSLAGITIPRAAAHLAGRVEHLVFVSSVVPPEGRSVMDTIPFVLRAYARRAIGHQGEVRFPGFVARLLFCNDASRSQFEPVAAQLCSEPPAVISEPASRRDMPADLPITYIMCFRDRALTPRRQRQQIANIGRPVQVFGLDAAHDAFASRPRELAALLDAIARPERRA